MAQAWSFVGASSAATVGANPSPTMPTGVQAGDILVYVHTSSASSGANNPSGYTNLVRDTTSSPYLAVWYKIAGASESTVSITNADTSTKVTLLCYRGAPILDVVGSIISGSSTQVGNLGTITTTSPDELVLQIYGGGKTSSSFGTWTAVPTGTTRVNSGTGTSYCGILVGDINVASAGNYSGPAGTISRASTKVEGVAIAFKSGNGLSGSTGAYTESGNAATFNRASSLSGTAGARTYTGNAATLNYVPNFFVTLSGQTVGITQGTPTTTVTGNPSLSGQVVTITQNTTVTTTVTGNPSITGQAVTITQGTSSFVPSLQLGLTGQLANTAQGPPVAAPAYTIAGQTLLSLTQGTVAATESVAVTLSGQTLSFSTGTNLSLVFGANITGASTGITVTQGNVVYERVDRFPTNQLITSATGTLVSAPSTTLVGQPLGLTQGAVDARESLSSTLAGQTLSTSTGATSTSNSIAVVGQTALGLVQGTVSTSIAVTRTISGQTLGLSQGTVDTNEATTVTLANQQILSSSGTARAAVDVSVTGQTLSLSGGTVDTKEALAPTLAGQLISISAGSLPAKTQTANVTNQQVLSTTGTPYTTNSVIITGQTLSLSGGTVDTKEALAPTLVGQTIGISYGTISISIGESVSSSPISISQGSPVALSTYQLTAAPALVINIGSVVSAVHNDAFVYSQNITANTGSVTTDAQVSITGQSFSLSQGPVTSGEEVAPTLDGQTLSSAIATDSLSTVNTTSISGISISLTQGSVTSGEQVAPTLIGRTLSLSYGTLSTRNIVFTPGNVLLSQIGSISSDVQVSITGRTLGLAIGTVNTREIIAPTLVGQELLTGASSVATYMTVRIVGAAVTSTQGDVISGEQVAPTLVGQTLMTGISSVVEDMSVALASNTISLSQGAVDTKESVIVSIDGQDLNLVQQTVLDNEWGATLSLSSQSISSSIASLASSDSVNVSLTGLAMTSYTGEFSMPLWSGDVTLASLNLNAIQGGLADQDTVEVSISGQGMMTTGIGTLPVYSVAPQLPSQQIIATPMPVGHLDMELLPISGQQFSVIQQAAEAEVGPVLGGFNLNVSISTEPVTLDVHVADKRYVVKVPAFNKTVEYYALDTVVALGDRDTVVEFVLDDNVVPVGKRNTTVASLYSVYEAF